ncbi:MAG: class I SAM-dependent methyltransferase [Synergistaceae bacterium]|nr:class I SAM-dependent methyltransferase [Synergistaceae bacterium]MBR0096373.1 class I SAM-dependent methyltransferase [Synergistaceae bacterium]
MKDVKDWTGNYHSIYTTLGASNHALSERAENDYYATEPRAVELLLEQEKFAPVIWECACGEGHISKVLEQAGYKVISTDLIYRGFGQDEPLDFLSEMADGSFDGDIITNPPYKYALGFLEQAIKVIKPKAKVAMFLKLTFLEGKKRREFFEKNPPKIVYVSSARLSCAKNGEFEKYPSSAAAYAWFVWEKGFKGEPVIKWIN